jgi:hypothetical protein
MHDKVSPNDEYEYYNLVGDCCIYRYIHEYVVIEVKRIDLETVMEICRNQFLQNSIV